MIFPPVRRWNALSCFLEAKKHLEGAVSPSVHPCFLSLDPSVYVLLTFTPTVCLSQSADMSLVCYSLRWCRLMLFEAVQPSAPHVSTPVNFRSTTEQSSYCPKQQQPTRSIHTDSAYELFRCSQHLQEFRRSWACRASCSPP